MTPPVSYSFSIGSFHMSDNHSPLATPHIYKSSDLGSIVSLRPRDSGTAKHLILMVWGGEYRHTGIALHIDIYC